MRGRLIALSIVVALGAVVAVWAAARDTTLDRAQQAEFAAMRRLRAGDSIGARSIATDAMRDGGLIRAAHYGDRAAMLHRLNLGVVAQAGDVVEVSLQQLSHWQKKIVGLEAIWIEGLLAARRGDAKRLHEADSLLSGIPTVWSPYHRASLALHSGDKPRAVGFLTRALTMDPSDLRPEMDPMFAPLRGYPPFESLIAGRE